MSFNSSLSTLVSQAYGQKDQHLCGVYLNRQLFLNIFLLIPLSILIIYIEPVLISLGQKPDLVPDVSRMCIITLAGYVNLGVFFCYQRFLQGQRETKLAMYANVLAFFIHIPTVYYLVVVYKYSLDGIAVSVLLHLLVKQIILQALIYRSPFNQTLVSIFHPDNFKNLGQQIKISTGAGLMMVMGWWAGEGFSVMATFLPIDAMAA